ncbi:MAG TPA: hypothetical protein PL029_02380 [Bacteroidia bacterium]|nr:hypothetical protein [Bacteroidia bacterium]
MKIGDFNHKDTKRNQRQMKHKELKGLNINYKADDIQLSLF